MTMPDEDVLCLDAFHYLLVPAVQLVGAPLIWKIGIEVLGYPPTWVDMVEEVELIENAIASHLEGKVFHHG